MEESTISKLRSVNRGYRCSVVQLRHRMYAQSLMACLPPEYNNLKLGNTLGVGNLECAAYKWEVFSAFRKGQSYLNSRFVDFLQRCSAHTLLLWDYARRFGNHCTLECKDFPACQDTGRLSWAGGTSEIVVESSTHRLGQNSLPPT